MLLSYQERFVSNKTLNTAIKYLKFATKLEYAMSQLKPYVQDLLYKIILPILYISDQEMTTFEEDPREYINSQYDFMESSMSPKAQACELLQELCKYSSTVKKVKKNGKTIKKRGKPDYMHAFLEFVEQRLIHRAPAAKQRRDPVANRAARFAEAFLEAVEQSHVGLLSRGVVGGLDAIENATQTTSLAFWKSFRNSVGARIWNEYNESAWQRNFLC